MKWIGLIVFLLFSIVWPSGYGAALTPAEVLVVANGNSEKSLNLARYYMLRRQIPSDNLVVLSLTDKEACSRQEFDDRVALPIRQHIHAAPEPERIRCLVVMTGIPLRVLAPGKSAVSKSAVHSDLTLGRSGEHDPETNNPGTTPSSKDPRLRDASAALDSELSLILAPAYPLAGWVSNPYFLGNTKHKSGISKEHVLMVSRLDGPSESIVRRIIDDSILAEKMSLQGIAYFDARWPDKGGEKKSGYALYDRSIHLAAGKVEDLKRMPVVVNDQPTLFGSGDCPQAALYCGWYSLTRYVDAFEWQRGAVGYHIASGECATLRRPGFRGWCKMMLEDGVAATIGPVSEPFVQGFPLPEIFFGFLTDGYLSLVECYTISLPYLSWKMVLIGDPLYRPFKRRSDEHRE